MDTGYKYVVLRSKLKAKPRTWNSTDGSDLNDPEKLTVKAVELGRQEAAELDKDPEVVSYAQVMPLKLHEPVERLPEDAPSDDEPWGLGVVRATSSTFTGEGIKVAVLDTGIDAEHEAFRGVDIMQRDFTGEGDGDTDGHGTHCAGTIFGQPVKGVRIGVALGVRQALIAKVIGSHGGSTESLLKAIQWALDNGANIISMSLGMDFPGFVNTLVKNGYPADLATSKALEGYLENVQLFASLAAFVRHNSRMFNGALLIAAAGNESRRSHDPNHVITVAPPAAADGIIAVGAVAETSSGFAVAPFSNSNPDVSAPGVDILSAQSGGGLVKMSGTSMAVPHVAGVATLWAEKLRRTLRGISATQLSQKLIGTATLETPRGQVTSVDVGIGIVQAPQH